jgi:hypothetical protein
VKAIIEVLDYSDATHSLIQIALREVVGGMTGDDVLAKRSRSGRSGEVRREVARVGVELSRYARPHAAGRLALPGRRARRGLAALESARETAALRSLANAAGMVEVPALPPASAAPAAQSNSGNTFVRRRKQVHPTQ